MIKKTHSVVLLPTRKPSRLFVGGDGEFYTLDSYRNPHGYAMKHLYIISDDEVPYRPDGGTNGLFLCLHELEHHEDAIVKNVGNCTGCRKIIASTDPELAKGWIKDADPERLNPDYVNIITMNGIQMIPQSFIELYEKEYNKGNKIDKVNVVCEHYKVNGRKDEVSAVRVKINLDNTISIIPIKTSWDRTEVQTLICQSIARFSSTWTVDSVEDWLKYNL